MTEDAAGRVSPAAPVGEGLGESFAEAPVEPRSAPRRPAGPGPTKLADWIGTHVLVAAVLLSSLYLLDPSQRAWGADDIPVLKYLPIQIAVSAYPWLLLSHRGTRKPEITLVLLTVATAVVLAGASYTVFIVGDSFADSFMGRALGMLALFPAYLVASRPECRAVLARWMWPCGILLSVSVFVGLVVWQLGGVRFVDQPHIYHEEVFLPASVALALYSGRLASVAVRWLLIGAFLAAGVISLKNTGFLATLVAGGALIVMTWRLPGRTGLGRVARNAAVLLFVALVGLVAIRLALGAPEALPSGSPELRLVTYAARIEAFLSSPWYGEFFVGSPFMEVGMRMVQSHSDLLDVLAFGGLLGAVVLILPFLRLVWVLPQHIIRSHASRDRAGVFVLALFPFILLEALVNPIWHQPTIMLFFWISVAFALGIRRNERGARMRVGSRRLARTEVEA